MINSSDIFYMHFLRSRALVALLLIAISITACDTPAGKIALSAPSYFEVDPLFSDYYRRLGGEGTVGPAISHLFSYGQTSYQYTLAGLMSYDPQAPEHARFSLEPIGLDLGVLEAAVPPPDNPELRYEGGHILYPPFMHLYQELGEERGAGKPLTEARYNPAMQRVEQYFENLGFYHSDADTAGDVHLLAYGLWKCASSCAQSTSTSPAAIVQPPVPVAPEFRKAVERLGQSLTGFALSSPYTAPDGAIEQVYENVILAILPGDNSRVVLRPLPIDLGMPAEPLETASSDPSLYFYPIDGANGYNVPLIFLDYLAQHGGLDASGPPIGILAAISDGIYRQCFANLCLEGHSQEQGPLSVRPTPLGFTFWQSQPQELRQAEPPAASPLQDDTPAFTEPPAPAPTQVLTQPAGDGIVVHVWKRFPILSPGQSQEIGVIVLQGDIPIEGLHADLILTLPDAESYRYDMEPTGGDGQSLYILEPADTPAGKPVQYQVCVYYRPGEATCVQDSYLVWQ